MVALEQTNTVIGNRWTVGPNLPCLHLTWRIILTLHRRTQLLPCLQFASNILLTPDMQNCPILLYLQEALSFSHVIWNAVLPCFHLTWSIVLPCIHLIYTVAPKFNLAYNLHLISNMRCCITMLTPDMKCRPTLPTPDMQHCIVLPWFHLLWGAVLTLNMRRTINLSTYYLQILHLNYWFKMLTKKSIYDTNTNTRPDPNLKKSTTCPDPISRYYPCIHLSLNSEFMGLSKESYLMILYCILGRFEWLKSV